MLNARRDTHDPTFFWNHLIKYLNPQKDSLMLDFDCGLGRHAVYIHGIGLDFVEIPLH